MKNLFLLLIHIFFCSEGLAQSAENKNISIRPDSELTITGDTNINKFRCGFNSEVLQRNVGINFTKKGSEIKLQKAILRLDNRGFDCGNKAINKDFHALLKTTEYPEIVLEVKKIDISEEIPTALVTITIAGKSKDYNVAVDNLQEPFNNCFTGKLKLNLKDFQLEPPKKAFGLIIIKEEIMINFSLRFGDL